MSKNLIVFYTDQLRRDCLGCSGNPVAVTPNIDALAQRGVVFRNHYAANPVCMPSRASFFTGRHLQAHRLIDNGFALPKTEITLPQVLAENGYHTGSVGKIHLTTMRAAAELGHEESEAAWKSGAMDDWTGPYYGFKDVQLSIGHGNRCFAHGAHYGKWVAENFPDVVNEVGEYSKLRTNQFGRSVLPIEAHSSTWVANKSIDFIRSSADKPFFLYASFPDPHHPFTVPDPYYSMFEHADFPEPHKRDGENDSKPIHYRRGMNEILYPKDGGAHRPREFTEQDWRAVYAATYGMIALIDHSIGRVMECLREQGLEDNTTIVLTSDHGDLMGDHHFLYKGPYPCRSLLNIPFIVADPGRAPRETDAVMSNVDAMPTMLDLLGVDIPSCVQGRSFKDVIEGGQGDPDHVALCSGWSKESSLYYHLSIYGDKYRITYYPNMDDGELYDLERDPHELNNLYHDPKHSEVRDALLLRLLRELGRAEPNTLPTVAWW